ncbi:hypothetical protein IH970_11810, partial [candidate division KSB1 bacterium]|nr:hypothetical protein [candidate division KSB1 bacterium]
MGQQQLLLLVLSAIIVGVSIVIGINMFASSATQANSDAVLQDCLNIGARAQEWYRKPLAMGGGNRVFTGNGGVTLVKLNIKATNANGSYLLAPVGAQTATIVGTGVEGS